MGNLFYGHDSEVFYKPLVPRQAFFFIWKIGFSDLTKDIPYDFAMVFFFHCHNLDIESFHGTP